MKTKTTVESIRERIAELKSGREKELAEIQLKRDEESQNLAAAKKAMEDATDATDLQAYERAKAEKNRAESALEMYSAKYSKVQKLDFITEEESDKVIDSLRASDAEITRAFLTDLYAALNGVEALIKKYERDKEDVRNTTSTWTREIHANYYSPTSTFAATGTHRSPTPIPVNVGTLCAECQISREYIERIRRMKHG